MSAISIVWSRIPWSAGCFGAWTDHARARDLPRIAAGDRRVLFAGEHVSQIPAWMEGRFSPPMPPWASSNGNGWPSPR